MKIDDNGRVPKVIAEGRIGEIDIFALEAKRICFLNKDADSPVLLIFKDQASGFYLTIYDHRKGSKEAFCNEGDSALADVFRTNTPCLGGFRRKGETLYFVLADIGTPDIRDGGSDEDLLLTRGGQFDRRTHRVINKGAAMHKPTKICLVEPRPIRA